MARVEHKTQIATTVDADLLRRLDEHCDRERRSRAFVLSAALEEFLDARDLIRDELKAAA